MCEIMENHPMKSDDTAPPLLWIVSNSDACAQSEQKLKERASTRGRNA